jgi:anti-anti-sigma factor
VDLCEGVEGPPLRLAVHHRTGRADIEVGGDLDLESAGALRVAVDLVLRDAVDLVILHLGGVRFVDAAGLRVVQACAEAAAARGVRFATADPSPAVLRLLELTRPSDGSVDGAREP